MKQIIINNDNLSRYSKRLKKILSEKYSEIKLHEAEKILATTLGSSSIHELRKILADDISKTKNMFVKEKTEHFTLIQTSDYKKLFEKESDLILNELSKFFRSVEKTECENKISFVVHINNIFCDYFILEYYKSEELNDIIKINWHKEKDVEEFYFTVRQYSFKEPYAYQTVESRIERIVEFFAEFSGINYNDDQLSFLGKWGFFNHNIKQKNWKNNVINYLLNQITMGVERKSQKFITVLGEKYYIYYGRDFTGENDSRIFISRREFYLNYIHMLLSYPHNIDHVLFSGWFDNNKIDQLFGTLGRIENLDEILEGAKKTIKESLPSNVNFNMQIENSLLLINYTHGKETITIKSNLEAFFKHSFRDIQLKQMEQNKRVSCIHETSWMKKILVPNIAFYMEIFDYTNNSKWECTLSDGNFLRVKQTIEISDT